MNSRAVGEPMLGRWLRFCVGTLGLAIFAGVLMSGATPPGLLGEVLRHNQAHAIDASPLFYTEVENMSEYELRVRELRDRSRERESTPCPQQHD